MTASLEAMKRANFVPSWIIEQMMACPDSLHTWSMGVHKQGTARARALRRLLTAAGIAATLTRDERFAPGLWAVSFPVKDYRRAANIADACYVGESWWPGKPDAAQRERKARFAALKVT